MHVIGPRTLGFGGFFVAWCHTFNFPERAAFGTLTDPTATWRIAAQDQATWRAMMEHTT